MERLVLLTVDVPVAIKRQGWLEVCDPSSLASQKLRATKGQQSLWACSCTVHDFEWNKQAVKQSRHVY